LRGVSSEEAVSAIVGARMAKPSNALERMRKICLSLPDTKETPTWGSPHFRVGEKIFAGCGEEKGKGSIGFKLEMAHAAAIVSRPGFSRAPYVGHKGWVSLDVQSVSDWDEVRELVHESYRLIAPKKSLAKLPPTAKPPHSLDSKRPAPKAAVETRAAKKANKKTAGKKKTRSPSSR
jgi:predicted DNA-binding protein (MmcQ/YjbR family)